MNVTNEVHSTEVVMPQPLQTTQEGAWVEVSLIDLPECARAHSPQAVASLAVSLQKDGQLQNIVLQGKPDGRYELIVGVGRLEAAQQLGWEKIRADVKEGLTDVQKLAMIVAENEEREDACPFYTASLYKRMSEAGHLTQEELAHQVGKDQTVVSRYLILAQVPAEVWKDHQCELTSLRQCMEIAKVKDVDHQKQLVEACVKEGLTGAALKKRAKVLAGGQASDASDAPAKAAEAPAPFVFTWKGQSLLIKGRLFTPHREHIVDYANELQEAYDRFMEEEKTRLPQAA